MTQKISAFGAQQLTTAALKAALAEGRLSRKAKKFAQHRLRSGELGDQVK